MSIPFYSFFSLLLNPINSTINVSEIFYMGVSQKQGQTVIPQMLNNRKLTKHNEFIEAHYQLSLIEHKLVALFGCLVSSDKYGDKDFYDMSARDLCKLIGLTNTNNYRKHIEKVCSKLMNRQTFWIGQTEVNWVASAKYLPNGIVSFEFSKRLKPYFIYKKGTHFTSWYVSNILAMRYKYSPKLYELHRQYFPKIKQRVFSIEELRKQLGIPEGKYKNYSDLCKYVIEPTAKELYEITDIGIQPFVANKIGKKVTHIGFAIFKGKTRPDTRYILQETLQQINEKLETNNRHTTYYNNRWLDYRRDLANFPEDNLPTWEEYLNFQDMKIVPNPMDKKGKHIIFKPGSQGELDFFAGKEIKRMKFELN